MNNFFVLSGISGAGKTHMIKLILRQFPHRFRCIIPVTTRKPRNYEQDGIDRFFINIDAYEKMQKNGELLLCNKIFDDYYAIRKTDIKYLISRYHVLVDLRYSAIIEFNKLINGNFKKIYIYPYEHEVALEKYELHKGNNEATNLRKAEAYTELNYIFSQEGKEEYPFNHYFENRYDIDSEERFSNLVNSY